MKNMIYEIVIFLMLFMMLLNTIFREESLVSKLSCYKNTSLFVELLKLFLIHLPILVALCFFDLFAYKMPMHMKWVRLKYVSYFLLDALFFFNSYSYVSILYNLHA